MKVDTWENFVFVNLDGRAAALRDFLGAVPGLVAPLRLAKKLKYFDRRVYALNCNWKVYVDNYLEINAYEGVMDTNLVLPMGADKCAVVFDYYFADISKEALKKNQASIKVSEKVQEEDETICDAVQRGLGSRAYVAGRLSVRREAGEHLFHRLLHADLTSALNQPAAAD